MEYKRLFNKGIFALFTAFILVLCTTTTVLADVGGICAEGVDNYNHSFQLTGNGAADIVAVAVAQTNKTGEELGYHTTWGGWCAAFINDCAYLAGQSSAIPFKSGATHDVGLLRQYILNSGGYVASSPKMGDIVFYHDGSRYFHVGLMIDSSNTIQGNVNGIVHRMTSPKKLDGSYSVSYVRPAYIVNTNGYLDVNGLLDGNSSGNLGEYGTCDVYINGSLVANDVSDFYTEYPKGTSYRIDDIKAKNGYSYDGIASGSLSGTVPSGGTADVRLKFSSCRLDVNGLLDGKQSGKTGSHGTFDVYLNGTRVADDVNDYYELVTKGSSYEIKDVKANDGYSYVPASNAGSLTGTIGSGKTVVSLAFNTVVEAGAEWKEMDFLPANITPETCDIEYNNHYKKTASTSPGSGWVKTGTGTTTYVNDGGVYESDFELSTSQTRVLVGWYYYHYCGASTGTNVEHYNDGTHTDYHAATDVDNYYVSGGPWADDNDSRYLAYQIKWKDGQWKDGLATCPANRSAIWYRRYQYQNKKAVTNYIWEKDSGWQSTKDSSANSVTYRFRLKDTEKPVIQSAEVTGITPSGYTVTCRAADNIGITRAVVTSWTDNEDENNPAVQEIIPDTSGNTCEFTVTVPISDHGSQYDTWYNTKICVYDKVGNTDEYTGENVRAYVPMVVHSSRKLQLPENLKEIEESAFEGSIAFGEAVLPDGVETIGTRAFAECSRLVAVYMPDSVTDIAADSFADSHNVVLICESNNAAAAFARAKGIPYITGE